MNSLSDLLTRKKILCISYPYTKFSPNCNRKIIVQLTKNGADVVELAVESPNSILLDNKNFQLAKYFLKKKNQKNLLIELLQVIKKVRKKIDCPLIIKSDTNTFLDYGLKNFFIDAAAANISGIRVTDLPPEESKDFFYFSKSYGVELIFSLNILTSDQRFANIISASSTVVCLSVEDLAKTKMLVEKIKTQQNKLNVLSIDSDELEILNQADGIIKSVSGNLQRSKLLKMVINQRKRLTEHGIL